jgi:hypothetical protein
MKTKTEKKQKDPRAEIIPAIWGITVGILGICIPLTAITDSGALLPALALIGATISSSIVWLTKTPERPASAELEKTIAELSHRVAQLEIDTRDLELRHSIEQSTRKQVPPTSPIH